MKNNWFMNWIEKLSNKTIKVVEFKPIPPEEKTVEPEIQRFPGHTNPPPPPEPPQKPIEPENTLKVRVEPYDRDCTVYQIHYSKDGIHWNRYNKNMLLSTVSLCSNDFPVLIDDFDKAVKIAKGLTEENILKEIERNQVEFDDYIKKLKDNIENRNKKWEN